MSKELFSEISKKREWDVKGGVKNKRLWISINGHEISSGKELTGNKPSQKEVDYFYKSIISYLCAISINLISEQEKKE